MLFATMSVVAMAQEAVVIPVKTSIDEVTVYLQNAVETRRASVSVLPGKTNLLFTGLSPYIDAGNIQAKVNGEVTLLMVNHGQSFLDKSEPTPEIKALQDKLAETDKKIATNNAYTSVLDENIDFLKANRQVGGTSSAITVASMREAAAYFNDKMTALKLERLELKSKLDALTLLRNDLVAQLADFKAKTNAETSVVQVLVEATKATKVDVELICMVTQAGWYPSYDIRAKSLNDPLEVAYKAHVWQNTKTDWKNVKLKLSSYNPGVSGVAPTMYPYRLDFPVALLENSVDVVELHDSKPSDNVRAMGLSSLKREVYAAIPERVITESTMSVDFAIKQTYTVHSDGKVVTVDIDRINMPATFRYFAVPKLNSDVYLTAELQDWEKYSFLPGEANVFFEGAYVGKTNLDVSRASDTLTLSLGVDKRILVKREKVKDYVSKKLIGSKKEDTRVWRTTVRNTRSNAVALQLLDQVPVSGNSEIEVQYEATPTSKLNAETGEIRWDTTVEGGKENVYQLKYTVKYPKYKSLYIE